jgi:hypothetical protein
MRAKVTYYGDKSVYVSGKSRFAVENQVLALMGRGWALRDNSRATGSDQDGYHCWLTS